MRVCLAGSYAITPSNRKIVDECDYILESFYYVKDWQVNHIKDKKLFLLDSGAFTFMSNSNKAVDWNDYLNRYIAFIKKYDVDYFFELDIDVVVGYEEVKRLRYKLEKATGKQCIPVWHKSRGIEEFKKLCEEYKYIAIGGIVTREIKPSEYDKMFQLVKYAKSKGVKVHGLGFTNLKLLERSGFYSVDSTSWKSGNRFGTLYLFKNGKLEQIKKPDNKRMVTGDQYSYVEKHSFREWVKYQKYMEKF